MVKPLVTVIVPSFNNEKTIKDCINSVRVQSYDNLEILVINDGSDDATPDILDGLLRLDERVRVVTTKRKGISAARNLGVSLAKGKYLSFVDSDDIVDMDYVEYLLNLVCTFDVPIASCQHRIVIQGKLKRNFEFSKKAKLISQKKWFELVLQRKILDLSVWGKIYRTELFDGIKFPNGKLFEDSSTTYRLVAKAKKIVVGGESKYNYKLRNGSITRSNFSEASLDLIEATKQMTSYIVSRYPDLRVAADLREFWAYGSTLNEILVSNDYFKYKKYVHKIKEEMQSRRTAVFTKQNPDVRLKIVAIVLAFGIPVYRHLLILKKGGID